MRARGNKCQISQNDFKFQNFTCVFTVKLNFVEHLRIKNKRKKFNTTFRCRHDLIIK